MKFNRKIKITLTSIALASLGAMAVLGFSLAVTADTVITGVYVRDQNLSGLTREQGEAVLAGIEKDFVRSSPLVIRYEDRVWQLRPDSIGLAIDREKVLDEAFSVAHKGSPVERWRQYRTAAEKGIHIPLYVKADMVSLEKELNAVAREVTVPPEDARLKINPDDTVEVVPSRDGTEVDAARAWQDIREIFLNPAAKPEINLSLIKASPGITTSQVEEMGVDGLLAAYTTTFNQNDTDRSYNIKIAASALDGVVVPPSGVFSFNGVVGSRSTEAGYKSAKVIINNELVDGLGGGVCQVSTTLYNAALLADMEIIDRTNHSIPVAYVPPGRDATVAGDFLDLRFKNTTPSHIYLKTLVGPGRVTVKIYGNSRYQRQVIIRTKVTETIPFKQLYEKDPTLGEGEVKLKKKGNQGLRVEAERVLLDNGQEKVEALPASLYHPVDQVVLIGPGVEPIGNQPAGIAGGIIPYAP